MRPNVQRAVRAAVGRTDPWLTLAFLALTCIGLVMVYSSSIAAAYADFGTPYYIAERELIWVTIGLVSLAVVTNLDYRHWKRISLPFFAVAMVMVAMVLIPHLGHMSNGARRWFALGAGVEIQPSELLKLALVLYMASWLTAKGEAVRDFKKTFVPFSLVIGVVCLLIIKEPDLGTAIVVASTMLAVVFVAGADLRHLSLVGAGAIGVAWFLSHSSSYRTDRLTAFLDPWKDPSGVGYHTIQALLALGSGGLIGDGLGNSTQKYVLPAPHTDSILAVIGEEWGLVGTLTVLILFLVIAYRGIRITMTAPDGFGRLLAAGITSWITFQALLNFGVITSSVPFTGVPLPFISYGGTSLIISMTAIGILLNISRHTSGEGFARQYTHHGRGDRGTPVPRAVGHSPAGQSDARPLSGQRRTGRGAIINTVKRPSG